MLVALAGQCIGSIAWEFCAVYWLDCYDQLLTACLLHRDTAAYEAIIEPGDVMFFPSCWAHYTESLDESISVTCRFWGD